VATPATLPVRPLHNPLSAEDEAIINNALHRTTVHHDLIERMKQAGIDTSEQEARNAMHHHVASTLKKLFFPAGMVPIEHGS
jgi:hypothetical protein